MQDSLEIAYKRLEESPLHKVEPRLRRLEKQEEKQEEKQKTKEQQEQKEKDLVGVSS